MGFEGGRRYLQIARRETEPPKFGRKRTFQPGFWARLFLSARWKLTLDPSSAGNVWLQTEEYIGLSCFGISTVTVSKALLWHTVEIRSKDRTDCLSGLNADTAQQLADDVVRFINVHLATAVFADKDRLGEISARIHAITHGNLHYLAHSDISKAIASVPGDAAQALSHPLFDGDLLPATLKAHLPASLAMLTDPAARHRYNENFVAHELGKFEAFFDDLGGVSLSAEQREACIRLEDSNLLVASAGSGKSATMVGKVAYALKKGLYDPSEILVLAFNKKAADQLKARLGQQLSVDESALGCRIATFHALGLHIIKEVTGRPPQLANWVDHPTGEAKQIEKIIQELKHSNPEFRQLWIELLTIFPKADLPVEVFGSKEDYYRYINDRAEGRASTIGTLADVYVKSLQEQRIANWLWLNSVEFEYERQISIPEGEAVRYVHPDFYYPQTQTIHEHFALNADGTSPFENYVQHTQSKREGYRKGELDFFETSSAQASDGTLLDHLTAELGKRGVSLSPKSEKEISEALKPVVIAHYHKLIGVCIKHIRASHLTLEMLLQRAGSLHDRVRAQHFAKVVWAITEAYSQKLEEADRIDFDSMIGDATKLVESGRYQSPYSLILVDEFQDISDPRAKLVKALKHQRAFTKLFAVGDDWQSIYRFTGSDITIFTQFEANFGASWQGRLEQTYRCNQTLAAAAAQFVQRNPEQIRKNVRSTRPPVPRSIRIIPFKDEKKKPLSEHPCLRLLDRLNSGLDRTAAQWRTADVQKLSVLVLWRYNFLSPFEGKPPTYSNIEVSGISFHRSKGLEADYTILLDVSEGDYGVPSRIEDDELLNLVIPRPEAFPYAEERRLFYVALTRASRGTFIFSNQQSPSRYIRELCEIAGDDVRFETVEGKPLDQCPNCLIGHMVKRQGRDGSFFLGCDQFPSCKTTRHVAQEAERQRINSNPSAAQHDKFNSPEGHLVQAAVAMSSGWYELQERLSDHNLEMFERGGGLALRRADSKEYVCKASAAGFAYSDLIRRFKSGFPGHSHTWLADRVLNPEDTKGFTLGRK